eukprot:CAMPEP_0184353622 /NCGR_PEP_ID=MMETSP1089-20130417/80775_1 /TAXON_ID=38269 ORGANISM="Gloeochaete wittrockiana, Strain SAG46.84" /NCGR_SAMPLE_ID=MMETSP1089 /ASSEMBLY_ACC=CAM_ASM_000445 /LENGTH=260 /DNA_ID=CAMNT_0026689159 /DNA_START=14 /DNA_END=793 /DNA_ORIENTATION=-
MIYLNVSNILLRLHPPTAEEPGRKRKRMRKRKQQCDDSVEKGLVVDVERCMNDTVRGDDVDCTDGTFKADGTTWEREMSEVEEGEIKLHSELDLNDEGIPVHNKVEDVEGTTQGEAIIKHSEEVVVEMSRDDVWSQEKKLYAFCRKLSSKHKKRLVAMLTQSPETEEASIQTQTGNREVVRMQTDIADREESHMQTETCERGEAQMQTEISDREVAEMQTDTCKREEAQMQTETCERSDVSERVIALKQYIEMNVECAMT